nr:photolyase [Spodoptera littoralis granulovirus]
MDSTFAQLRQSNFDLKVDINRTRVIHAPSSMLRYTGVVYWMSRDSRIEDNWAFLYAQQIAIQNQAPLHVCFCLVTWFCNAGMRQFHFLLEGLKFVRQECKRLNVSFHLLDGSGDQVLPDWCNRNDVDVIVCDFNPTVKPMEWVYNLKKTLPCHMSLIQVDAHNILPCWKQPCAPSTHSFRKIAVRKLNKYLTQFPDAKVHPYGIAKFPHVDWDALLQSRNADASVEPVTWAEAGYHGAIKTFTKFVKCRIQSYHELRNKPTEAVCSNLSPWLHFGQISAQRVILHVKSLTNVRSDDIDTLIDECFIRRELAYNFRFHTKSYSSVDPSPHNWASITLKAHEKDRSQLAYSLNVFKNADTHDLLWHGAQTQLVREGKMHQYMRMYWCKKILEWSDDAQTALNYAIYLNDKYSLDGRDPNGYVGCLWSICGVHDRAWREIPIYGKIRYMNYNGCVRKFNVNHYINQYRK